MKKENLIALIVILMFGWSILSIGMFFATIAGMIPMLLFINLFFAGAMTGALGIICIMIILALSEEPENQPEASQ